MLLWMLLAALYLFARFALGLTTLRKGHTVLFWVRIFLPFLWIVGALMHPTEARSPQRAGARSEGLPPGRWPGVDP